MNPHRTTTMLSPQPSDGMDGEEDGITNAFYYSSSIEPYRTTTMPSPQPSDYIGSGITDRGYYSTSIQPYQPNQRISVYHTTPMLSPPTALDYINGEADGITDMDYYSTSMKLRQPDPRTNSYPTTNMFSPPESDYMDGEEDGITDTEYYSTSTKLRQPDPRMEPYRMAEMPPPRPQDQTDPSAWIHLWVITGPSGAGKSRVGKHLRDKLGLIFIEGDDFLNDDDKAYMSTQGVLEAGRHAEVRAAIIDDAIWQVDHGTADVVVACSALRLVDRNAWRTAVSFANRGAISAHGTVAPSHPIHLHFVCLAISEVVSRRAVRARRERTGHHVTEDAVPAQFIELEPPLQWEHDCFTQISWERQRLKAAVERHVVKMGVDGCDCMLCYR